MSDKNEMANVEASTTPRKRPGRPKGSKNAPKPSAVPQLSALAVEPANLSFSGVVANEAANAITPTSVGVLDTFMPATLVPKFTSKRYDVRMLANLRGSLNLNPQYQRNSGVWSARNKRTLIATLLLGWIPVPLIYLRRVTNSKGTSFEVTDGKQRLSTIFDFLDNKLALGDDIPELAGMRFKNLPEVFKEIFMSAGLETVILENYDEGHVRHMFRILQQGVKTNAQENRNASMGYTRDVVETISRHKFFEYAGFSNKRLGYQQVAGQLLLLTLNGGEPTNISAKNLNEMYMLLGDNEKYGEGLDLAHDRLSQILTYFAEGIEAIPEDTDFPKGMLAKGSVITLYTVYCALLKSTNIEEVSALEFMEQYMDFYSSYVAGATTVPSFIRYTSFVGGGSDGEESIRGRRDIVLEYIADDFTATLADSDNTAAFDFGFNYEDIKTEAAVKQELKDSPKAEDSEKNVQNAASTDTSEEGNEGESETETKDAETIKASAAEDSEDFEDEEDSGTSKAGTTPRTPRTRHRKSASA